MAKGIEAMGEKWLYLFLLFDDDDGLCRQISWEKEEEGDKNQPVQSKVIAHPLFVPLIHITHYSNEGRPNSFDRPKW